MSFLLLFCRYTVWHLIRSAFSCRDFNYKNCLAINLFYKKTKLIIRTDKVVIANHIPLYLFDRIRIHT